MVHKLVTLHRTYDDSACELSYVQNPTHFWVIRLLNSEYSSELLSHRPKYTVWQKLKHKVLRYECVQNFIISER